MLYAIGDINVDLIWQAGTSAGSANARCVPALFHADVGGVAWNIAASAAQLSEECVVVGKIGDDFLGEFILSRLRASHASHYVSIGKGAQTGVVSLLPRVPGQDRTMLFNERSANQALEPGDLADLAGSLTAEDILFTTGYSLFRDPPYRAVAQLLEQAHAAHAKLVLDLVPHRLDEVGTPEFVRARTLGALPRLDLCIGEFRTWAYLLHGASEDQPTAESLRSLAADTRQVARYACIRYGFEHCERQTLIYEGEILSDAATAYTSTADSRGYSELLSMSLVQQLFLGRHAWLHNPDEAFTIPPSVLQRLPSLLKADASILDIGCGYGRVLEDLRALGFRNVTGIDPSLSMVQAAQAKHSAATILHSTANALVGQGETFDGCLLLGVLTSLQRDELVESLLEDVRRLTRPGGIVVVADFLTCQDEHHTGRYAAYSRRFPEAPFGLFLSENGAVNRHFPREFLSEMLGRRFHLIETEVLGGRSVNGHPVQLGLWYCERK